MAEAVITFFLRRLGYQLIQEGIFLTGVEDEVEWIRKEFQAMLAFLKDADKRVEREEIVADWIKEVRNLAYHAEDVIDEHVTRMATIQWYSLSFFKVRRQIGQEIAKIKKEVVEVRKRRDRYSFPGLQEDGQVSNRGSGTGGVSSCRGPGLASPFVQEDDIVGIEDDVDCLLSLLLEGDKCNRLVISIYGMGGIGKTTVVKEVFKKAKHRFDCFAWFFVSPSCNLRDVLRNVLFWFKASRGEAALDVMDAVDERWLLERTNEYLQGKNYLLVLDDIWDEKLWEDFKHALPQTKGRVILTTRIRDIESTVNENSIIHEPQPLPSELAWKVFCKKAFRPEGTCPGDLKEVAEEFVRRCAGLPLALVAIGGALSSKGTNLPAWQSILHNFDWDLDHHRDLERLRKALLFSYNHLPFYLKYCFLYTALFPPDYEIGRKRLIRMWIAEGFVKERQSRTEEEVANHYFVQLADRSMIQAVTSHARDAVNACKVHALMRDVANHMLNEEKFGQILAEDGTIQERQRRLSVHGNADNIPADITKMKLRTLLMSRVSTEPSTRVLKKLLAQLKLVRVLDFQGVPIEKLPDEIGDLIHLRYLDLRGTKIKCLPKSVKNLRNLQTLDVRNTEVSQLPASINELQQLRHLLLSSFHDRDNGLVKMSRGRKRFLKLQTLSGVECDGGLVKEITSLTSLRKLCIGRITEDNSRELCRCLEGLRILRSLTMISESPLEQNVEMESCSWSPRYMEKLKLQIHMERLPSWFEYLDSLHTLYLFKTFLVEDPFPRLGRLPNLAILTLASSAFTNKVVQCSGGFPRLKLLRILDIVNWTTWMPIEESCMPELQFLLIADCLNLTSLPDGFNHLTSLHDLSLVGMSSIFLLKLQTEDRGKVSHVQEVSIVSEVNGEFIMQQLHYHILQSQRYQVKSSQKLSTVPSIPLTRIVPAVLQIAATTLSSFNGRMDPKASDKILSYNDVVLRRSDLDILSGPYFLNDRVIEFYLSYLSSSFPSEDVLLVSPSIAFWIKECPDAASVKDFVEPLHLSRRKLIIFPINNNSDVSLAEGGTHWSLLAFERNTNVFVHHDSSSGMNKWDAKRVYNAILPYTTTDASYLDYPDTPKQENGYDCGVYVLAIARVICNWYASSGSKDNVDLWFPSLKEQINPSAVSEMRNEVLRLVQDLMARK